MRRSIFREEVFDRDDGKCVVPTCNSDAADAHHIIERKLWDNGGYISDNGASVCSRHHHLAEANAIPPQAFWRWIDVTDVPLPETITGQNGVTRVDLSDSSKSPKVAYDKWGEPLDAPPHAHLRDYIKYPSTRHLPFSHERDTDDKSEFYIQVPDQQRTLDAFDGSASA